MLMAIEWLMRSSSLLDAAMNRLEPEPRAWRQHPFHVYACLPILSAWCLNNCGENLSRHLNAL